MEQSKQKNKFSAMFSILSTEGRVGRLEYFVVVFISSMLFIFMQFLELVFETPELRFINNLDIYLLIETLDFIPVWIVIAYSIKRCHDLEKSGFYLLIPFFMILLFFLKGKSNAR